MDRCLKTKLERAKFIVDRDPDGLEDLSGWMLATPDCGRNRFRDHAGKVSCVGDRAGRDNGSSDAPSQTFLSVSPENVSNVIH